MILFFYNIALFAVLVASSPWWLWRMATTSKYREGLSQRLGRVPAWLRSIAKQRPVVWLHAVSVGEVLAISRLVSELDQAFPQLQVLISTTTRTGQALARERFGENRVFYCPLDLPWAVGAYIQALRPRMLILAETEFWPNLLCGCFRRGIPVVVVNARISDRSWPRYRMLRGVWKPILSQISLALTQSEIDAIRLREIGCQSERVKVAGNLKFDVRAPNEVDVTRALRETGLQFLVAGSTLDGEETALLAAWPQLMQVASNLAFVLAPRHPERFAAVVEMIQKLGIPWQRRSEWNVPNLPNSMAGGQILLLDTIGELASVYSIASVAFVGGSLFPTGGHNPLEPAQFGVPIVTGPHFANFRAITDDLLKHDALRIASKEELADVLVEIFTHPAEANAMGARAKQVFEQQAGATRRTVVAIQEILAAKGQTV